ncbi:MAG TPA: thioredoxin-disulfide reductase [Planctomycetota bacterium]|nr:thioredoxin-disulfide reductase [Planctomycetota bacterium]
MAHSSDVRNTVIIGSGPSGLTAAIYAARANLKPLVLAGDKPGGQLTNTSEVENFPGFRKGILGPQLMEDMIAQAQHQGAQLIYEKAASIDTRSKPIAITYGAGADTKVIKTHTLIFATGAAPRFLGTPGELTFQPPKGAGVTYCAVCDGNFYRTMPVVVVGGGDSAMEEANYLAKLCSSVTVIHRREGFRASKIMIDRAKANPVIKWELNQVVDEVLGDEKKKLMTSLRLKNTQTGATKELQVAGLFIAIGHIPNTSLLKGQVEMDEEGYIKVDDRQRTGVEGVYAAGDCHDRRYRQAVTAAGMGCKAALEVERYLTEKGLD